MIDDIADQLHLTGTAHHIGEVESGGGQLQRRLGQPGDITGMQPASSVADLHHETSHRRMRGTRQHHHIDQPSDPGAVAPTDGAADQTGHRDQCVAQLAASVGTVGGGRQHAVAPLLAGMITRDHATS